MTTRSWPRAAVSAFSTSCRVAASAKMNPRYRSPSGSGQDLLAERDGDRQAGDPGHGRGAGAAFHGAEHARAGHGEHEHARGAGRVMAAGRGGPAEGVGQHQLFQARAAGEAERA